MFKNNAIFLKTIITLNMIIAFSIIVFFSNTFEFGYALDFSYQRGSNVYTKVPILLPFGISDYSIVKDNSPYNANQINNPTINNKASPVQSISSVSCNNNNFRDDFNSKQYDLIDGQTSPNGLWFNIYAGHGTTGVEQTVQTLHFFETKATYCPSSNRISTCNIKRQFL